MIHFNTEKQTWKMCELNERQRWEKGVKRTWKGVDLTANPGRITGCSSVTDNLTKQLPEGEWVAFWRPEGQACFFEKREREPYCQQEQKKRRLCKMNIILHPVKTFKGLFLSMLTWQRKIYSIGIMAECHTGLILFQGHEQYCPTPLYPSIKE